MTRTSRLRLGIVLAASLCLTAGASSSTAAETARAPVVKEFVAYGDPPVSVEPGQRARLSFQGRRGDVVHLSGATNDFGSHVALRTHGRELRETWSTYQRGGYYRLASNRRYTFTVRISKDYPSRASLLLEKLDLRTVTRNDAPVRFGANRRGFVSAVSFDLEPGERTMITTPGYASPVLIEHEMQLVYGDPILEVGQPLATARGDYVHLGPPIESGEVIVLVGRKGTVRAIGSEIVPVTVDAVLTPVKASESPREVSLRFPAEVGQLVHLSGVPTGVVVSPTMYGPTQPVSHAGQARVWRVTEAGRQTIGLFPPAGTAFDAGVAVVTRIGSMTADGPALTFSSPEPGRWVYADVDGGYPPVLAATGSTFAPGTPWYASITEPTSANCLEPHGPNGCGITAGVTVTEATPQASSFFPAPLPAGSFVLLEVPPETSGSVDLQVTKVVPPAA